MSELREWLDELWRWSAGLPEKKRSDRCPSVDEIVSRVWSDEWERFRKNRMVMGYFRYGGLALWNIEDTDYLLPISIKLKMYREDGELEHLVDAANFLMIEFVKRRKMGKWLNSVDDGYHYK